MIDFDSCVGNTARPKHMKRSRRHFLQKVLLVYHPQARHHDHDCHQKVKSTSVSVLVCKPFASVRLASSLDLEGLIPGGLKVVVVVVVFVVVVVVVVPTFEIQCPHQ